jgi:hypothetical protein
METGGAEDAPLFGQSHRRKRAAKFHGRSLAHFDDDENVAVQANEIEFAGPAAQVACKNFQAAAYQIVGCKLFGGCAPQPGGRPTQPGRCPTQPGDAAA